MCVCVREMALGNPFSVGKKFMQCSFFQHCFSFLVSRQLCSVMSAVVQLKKEQENKKT